MYPILCLCNDTNVEIRNYEMLHWNSMWRIISPIAVHLTLVEDHYGMSRRDLISEIGNQSLITTYPSFAHDERLWLGVIPAFLQIESLALGSASRNIWAGNSWNRCDPPPSIKFSASTFIEQFNPAIHEVQQLFRLIFRGCDTYCSLSWHRVIDLS